MVLVAGDSGVGKSSLCRAGVLAQVLAGALQSERKYEVVTLLPGKHPAVAVVAALAPLWSIASEQLLEELLHKTSDFARRLQRHPEAGRGLLLFIDQAEELITQSETAEAQAVSRMLGLLTTRVAGLRVLLGARGDFLTRLAALPGLGAELSR